MLGLVIRAILFWILLGQINALNVLELVALLLVNPVYLENKSSYLFICQVHVLQCLLILFMVIFGLLLCLVHLVIAIKCFFWMILPTIVDLYTG